MASIRPSLIATPASNEAVSVTTVAPEITRSAMGVVGFVMSLDPFDEILAPDDSICSIVSSNRHTRHDITRRANANDTQARPSSGYGSRAYRPRSGQKLRDRQSAGLSRVDGDLSIVED